MNLILLEPGEISGRTAQLRDRRAEHLQRVLGVAPGQQVRVGMVRGGIGLARVTSATGGVDLRDIELDGQSQPPPVDLAVAMPRPKTLSRLLQSAAAVGVGRIDIFNAWKVEKSYLRSPRLEAERIRDDVFLGCEQGGHTWVPEVAVHQRFVAFLEHLPVDDSRQRLVAHPRAAQHIEQRAVEGRCLLVVGPDGGFTERELDSLAEHRFTQVRAVRSVLRTDSAVVALLAQLELIRRM